MMSGPKGNEIYDSVPICIAVSKCIRIRREYLGFDQSVVAKKCGMSQSTLSRIEAGIQTPNIGQFSIIARSLNLMPSDLMTIVENAARWPS